MVIVAGKCDGLGIYGSGGMDVVVVVVAALAVEMLAVKALAVEAAGGMEAVARQWKE